MCWGIPGRIDVSSGDTGAAPVESVGTGGGEKS